MGADPDILAHYQTIASITLQLRQVEVIVKMMVGPKLYISTRAKFLHALDALLRVFTEGLGLMMGPMCGVHPSPKHCFGSMYVLS